MKNPKLRIVSVRVTEALAKTIEKYLHLDAYVNPSDFMRDAIREKLRRDAPRLYREMLGAEVEEEPAP